MSSRTEQLIQQKVKEIEELRATQYTQDIIDVLQNKKHTAEELYGVCKAFTANIEKGMRQHNLEVARQARKNKQETSAPVS